MLISALCLQRKVLQLQQNVSDWKHSYDLLMKELRKLSLENVVEKEELIKEVKVHSMEAKVGHVTAATWEGGGGWIS